VFLEAAQATRGVLAAVTLADLIEREQRESGRTMYHI
jgi:DNA-binding IscR family transcriptional regulator